MRYEPLLKQWAQYWAQSLLIAICDDVLQYQIDEGRGSNAMKYVALLVKLCLLGILLASCSQENATSPEVENDTLTQLASIDPGTPATAQPLISSPEGTVSAPPGNNWNLVWSDEFNGNKINSSKWDVTVSPKSRKSRPNIGVRDWWWRENHAFLDGNGKLTLRASKVDRDTMYTGSVDSRGIFETRYGYFEARIKIAETAKGNHTAFWMNGKNQGNVDGTANDGAEIDVFESAWLGDYTKSVIHIDGYKAAHRASTKRWNAPNIHSGYHTYGLNWTPKKLEVYYDGVKVTEYGDKDWVPDVRQWLWLSVGASFGDGNFRAQPVGTLSNAKVEYVRVWKRGGGEDPSADTVRLVNKATGKWLRTLGTADDARIVLADSSHTGGWTQWNMERTTGNYFQFVNTISGKHFRPVAAAEGSALRLKPEDFSGSWTQWETVKTGDSDGSVYIRNKETGKFIRPRSSASGASIMLTSASNKGDMQKWLLEPVR